MINAPAADELQDALKAIHSLLWKCEKSQEKLLPGKPQHTLLKNRIKALRISSDLIAQAISQKDEV